MWAGSPCWDDDGWEGHGWWVAKKMGQLTLKRQTQRAEEVRVLTDEVARWINNLLKLELSVNFLASPFLPPPPLSGIDATFMRKGFFWGGGGLVELASIADGRAGQRRNSVRGELTLWCSAFLLLC